MSDNINMGNKDGIRLFTHILREKLIVLNTKLLLINNSTRKNKVIIITNRLICFFMSITVIYMYTIKKIDII